MEGAWILAHVTSKGWGFPWGATCAYRQDERPSLDKQVAVVGTCLCYGF